MNAADRPRLAKGVRLRRESEGETMLLVPEGTLLLNDSAAAALALVDGTRSVAEVVAVLEERFDAAETQLLDDVTSLFARLHERGLLET